MGRWCCVVAATDKALKGKREIIKSLLKAVAAGSDIIARDKERAFKSEARWTRTPKAVGRKSIANVDYVTAPDADWIKGVDTWIELMLTSGHFKKNLKGKSREKIRGELLDLSLTKEVLKEMKLKQ